MEISLRKDRLLLARNFALYYGSGYVDFLSRFDVVVIEPKGLSTNEINYLKKQNTMVISYLSLLEVRPDEAIYKLLDEEDFLIINGQRIFNEEFGTYLVNIQSEKWIHYIIKEIQFRFNKLETDGIFIDTIGDIEMKELSEKERKRQLTVYLNLLQVIKILYPKHLIIQNNGLEYVSQLSVPYIDGICWENPPFMISESKEWVDMIIERLNYMNSKWNVKAFLLFEETNDKEQKGYLKARKIARENGFLIYNAPRNYVDGVNVIKG